MFSMKKKIVTELKCELNNETACSLLCVKENTDSECFDNAPSYNVLKQAKMACSKYYAS